MNNQITLTRPLRRAHGRTLLIAAAIAFACGCTTLQPVTVGQNMRGGSEADVRATFGVPTDVYRLADGTTRWFYSKQPLGQQSYAADFDANGKLTNFRNTLETQELYKARVDVWTRRDVEENFGKPREPNQYFPRMRREVWSYRFRHENLWPSMFNFYFDDAGVLRQTQITPDPLADPKNGRF